MYFLCSRTNRKSLFQNKHLAFEKHFSKNTLEIPEGAPWLENANFLFQVLGLQVEQLCSGGCLWDVTDLLGSAVIFAGIQTLWSNLTIIHLHKMTIYSEDVSLMFITHPFFLLSICFTPTHILKATQRLAVCICKCKFDSSSCVCVCVCVGYLQQTLEFEQLWFDRRAVFRHVFESEVI